MTRKYLLLLTIVAFVGLLFGCHTGGHAPFANPGRNGEPAQTLTATVNANGKLDTPIVFSSGATINTTENNTMQEGVVVNVTEIKTSSLGVNPMGEPAYIYVYTISANIITQDALGNDVSTPVSSLEKPISITLPTNHLGTTGIAYVGIRASENEPWRFSKVSEDDTVTISIRNLRASSTEKLSSFYKFGLFRMGIQLALFVYNKPVEETSSDISADSLNLICTEKILYDDSDKYTEDLDVALKIKGINLDRLKASDFAIKVIYKSENKTPESIKADGQSCSISTEEKADAAVSGKSYYVHTLTVPALNEGDLMSGEASLKFVLNLKGIAKADFPTSFLIEISNNGNIENLIPFTYSKSMEFTVEKASTPVPEPVATYEITYDLDGGEPTGNNPTSYDKNTDDINLSNPTKNGYIFIGWTGTDLDKATINVTIAKGSTGNRSYKANWKQNAPDEYTLNLIKGSGIATVTGDGTYKEGDSVTASCTMLAGYEFDSWTGDFTTEKITMPAKDVNMTANAKPIQYKITLDAKGGTLEKNSIEYNIETEEFNLPVPNKNGYDFTGWTGSNGDTPERVVKIEKGTTGNKSYTANYSAVAYTITYTLGADDVTNDNPSGFNPDSETFTLKEPERTGYTFTGWTGSNGDTPQKEVTIAKGTTEKKSYTANWSINSYNLTINKGTGIATVSGAGSHEYNSSVTASCTMLAGYEFDKWTGDFTTEIFNMPANNATMTANAKLITYSIAYDLGGGALANGVTNPSTYDVTSATITLNEPIREGYTFIGWTGSNGNIPEKILTINKETPEDKSYTANWSINSYNLTINKGTGISTVTGDGMHEYNSSVTASCTMLASYEFDKWTGDFTTATFNMPAQNATMTANARPSTYTITLSGCDGATVDYTSKDYNIETANFNLPTPTKNYYGFNGWVLNGGDPVESVTIAQGTHENRTYTADFTPSTFTITLNPSDGTVEYTSKNYNVETATFTLPTPTRNKCKFLGWSLNSGAPVESVEIAQGTHENRTYVARWTMDDVLTFTLAEGVTLEMRRCPAGTFQMGSPTTENGRYNNEKQHSVTISKDFWMGTYEVTQEQYFVIMGTNPSQFRDNTNKNVRPTTSANYPVENVASTYILTESTGFNAKLNASLTAQLAQLPLSYKFDLPTEAQWEYACRAGTTTSLNNGTNIASGTSSDDYLNVVAWYKQNWGTANNKPHTVGGKAPNAWGLYDMHGNVSEWCKDRYAADYPTEPVEDPFLPWNNGSDYRVWRGGAWDKDPKDCRSATRSCSTVSAISNYRGFRLVLVAAE